MARWKPALLRYLRVIVPEAAEDVAADTWVHVVRGLAALSAVMSGRGGPGLFTTARRRAIDEAQAPLRRPASPLAEVAPERLPVWPDAAERGARAPGHPVGDGAGGGAAALQAEVILLRVVAGLDNQTVARLTGRSPGAVRVAAHRGLRRLAQMLAETGVTL